MVFQNLKKVYGPYVGRDNRKRVILSFNDGRKRTMSYPKYIMSLHIGRELTSEETVDHIDCDVTNNDVSNLRILDRSSHSSIDCKRVKEQQFICPVCKKKFVLANKKLNDAVQNRKKGKRGPFCGKPCAGKASHKIEEFEVENILVEHYTNKSLTRET